MMPLPVAPPLLVLSMFLVPCLFFSSAPISPAAAAGAGNQPFVVDGKVIELDESNFDSAISYFDYVLVDFYAPWCGHCKRLSPELDAAAPVLARLKEPIVIAKIDADKYRRLSSKYEIDGFPTLKIFVHGVPTEYYGPRKADLLVRFLKKFVSPDVAILDSDSAVHEFIESAGTFFPIYIGFGMEESTISKLAAKYKKKAWFAVAKGFSDIVMEVYDFDKVPALMSLHPDNNEKDIFYGPFDDEFLESFVKQNLLPLCMTINSESLKLLKDDQRKIVVTVVEDEYDAKSKELVKLLKAAASANRDLLFAYVGQKQWRDFVETFGIDKKTKLPKIVVWDGNEEYFSVIGSEGIGGEDQGSEITRFLAGFREGKMEARKIAGPSFMSFINSSEGFVLVFVIGCIVLSIFMLIIYVGKAADDDYSRASGCAVQHLVSSSSQKSQAREVHVPGNKED